MIGRKERKEHKVGAGRDRPLLGFGDFNRKGRKERKVRKEQIQHESTKGRHFASELRVLRVLRGEKTFLLTHRYLL